LAFFLGAWAWPDHCLGNFFLASLSLWFRVTLRSATDGLSADCTAPRHPEAERHPAIR